MLLVVCLLFGRFVNNDYFIGGVCGFLIGMSLEDLLFKDWAVVTNNCHKSHLIEFMRRTEDADASVQLKNRRLYVLFSEEIVANRWITQMMTACTTAFRATIRLTVPFPNNEITGAGEFVLPLNKILDISLWITNIPTI